MVKSTVSSVIENIQPNTGDEDLQEQLSTVCHACRECTRFKEESAGTSEFMHMSFDGQFSESIHRFVDVSSLVH